MEYSTQRATSDGTLVLLDLSIQYFDRSEIAVFFDGVVDALPWEWVGTTDKKISFTPAVPLGVEVLVRRSTDLSKMRNEFSLGAAFTESSIDEDFTQILHIAQETKEGAGLSEIFNDLNFHGYKAANVGAGTASTDAVNVQQLSVHDAQIVQYKDETQGFRNEAEGFKDAAAEYAANLPNAVDAGPLKLIRSNATADGWDYIDAPTFPSPSVANGFLKANADADGWEFAVAGTSAGNVVLVQAGGKLPALDASNLTNVPTVLPSQTGNSGRYLTTDGTSASWGTVAGAGALSNIKVTFHSGASGTFTTTLASPAVLTKSAHRFINGQTVRLSTTGALPTGLSAGVTYFVINATANTFNLSQTRGGPAINTSGTQSGTHTVTPVYDKAVNSPSVLRVELVGGGGTPVSAVPGPGGGYSSRYFRAADLAATETLTGGAAGGSSSFGSYMSATGNGGIGVGGDENMYATPATTATGGSTPLGPGAWDLDLGVGNDLRDAGYGGGGLFGDGTVTKPGGIGVVKITEYI